MSPDTLGSMKLESCSNSGAGDVQIEMGLDPNLRHPSSRTSRMVPRRKRTSQWWFRQMHRIVDSAFEARPAPVRAPMQTMIPLSR